MVLIDRRLITAGGYARSAIGPDLRQMFTGSEGTLGVIVRTCLELHRLPDYGRVIVWGFSSFANGLEVCREVLQHGANPAALRLYDNPESGVQFGLSETSILLIADEGQPDTVDAVLVVSKHVCKQNGGELDSKAILERWLDTWCLTGKSAESFKKSPDLVADAPEMVGRWCDLNAAYGDMVATASAVPRTLAGLVHQSHVYVDGACLHFSLCGDVAVERRGAWYRAARDAANAVLIRHNTSLSHHHDVELLRSPYMQTSLGGSLSVSADVKKVLNPQDILGLGRLGLSAELHLHRADRS